MKELPTPADVEQLADADEVLRVWVADHSLHCALDASVLADPEAWGMVLADVARRVATATQRQEGKDPGEVLRSIRTTFDHELRISSEDEPENVVEKDDIGQ